MLSLLPLRGQISAHPVAGPVPIDVQAVVRRQVVDPHCAGVAGPGEDAPSLRGLAEAVPLVDVVPIPGSGALVEIQALARGHVLDVVATAIRGTKVNFWLPPPEGIVGD